MFYAGIVYVILLSANPDSFTAFKFRKTVWFGIHFHSMKIFMKLFEFTVFSFSVSTGVWCHELCWDDKSATSVTSVWRTDYRMHYYQGKWNAVRVCMYTVSHSTCQWITKPLFTLFPAGKSSGICEQYLDVLSLMKTIIARHFVISYLKWEYVKLIGWDHNHMTMYR
jgi:hypothetical protein